MRESFFVDGPASRLWVQVRGTGDPVSIWSHGITSSIEEIAPFSAGTHGTRVLFDLRGHGRSDAPDSDAAFGYESVLEDILFLAGKFGATRAFGVSVSADALTIAMARDPGRFERVCLFIPGALDEPNNGTEHFPAFAAELEMTPLKDFATKALNDPVYGLLFAKRPHWRRLVRQRILRMNATGVPRALRAYANAPAPLPDPTPLTRVQTPVLICAHEDDPLHDAAIARRLAALLPNATLRVWPEPLAMLDDVPEFAKLVGQFLSA